MEMGSRYVFFEVSSIPTQQRRKMSQNQHQGMTFAVREDKKLG